MSRLGFDNLEDRTVPAIIPVVAGTAPNDFTIFKNAITGATSGDTIQISGKLDWSTPAAKAAWGAAANATYGWALPHLNNITVTSLTNASTDGFKGPGDDNNLISPLYFDGAGTDQTWNIHDLSIKGFDIGIYVANSADPSVFAPNSGLHITNNVIVSADGVADGGIVLSASPNMTVQGNTIYLPANGSASNAAFGITMNSFPKAWDNLLIDNNTVYVGSDGVTANTNDTLETVVGISENTDAIGSNITVSNNKVINAATNKSPQTNKITAYDITSESVSSTSGHGAATVSYTGNQASNVGVGFAWGDDGTFFGYGPGKINFTGSEYLGVNILGSTLTNANIGYLARYGGEATIGTYINGATTIASTINNFNGIGSFGTAFSADGAGTVLTVTDSPSNFVVNTLKSETNGGIVNLQGIGGGIQSTFSDTEGNVGNKLFSVPVTLNAAPGTNQYITVDYTVTPGSASGNDYNSPLSGTLTFSSGVISRTIAIFVIGDSDPEPNETINITLSNEKIVNTDTNTTTAGTLSNTNSVVTIVDDDSTTIALSNTAVSLPEGQTGTTPFTFSPSLVGSLNPGDYLTASWAATAAGSGAGFADGNDFTANSGTLTFVGAPSANPGAPALPTAVTKFVVDVAGDSQVEPNEIFNTTISNVQLHRLNTGTNTYTVIAGNISGPATVTGTIQNDDTAAGHSISIANVSQAEGAPRTAGTAIPNEPAVVAGYSTMTFTITYTGSTLATGEKILVNYTTAIDSGGLHPADGNDFIGGSGQVTFLAGTTTGTTRTFTVSVKADTITEPDETFLVKLTTPANNSTLYTFGQQNGIGMILNDD